MTLPTEKVKNSIQVLSFAGTVILLIFVMGGKASKIESAPGGTDFALLEKDVALCATKADLALLSLRVDTVAEKVDKTGLKVNRDHDRVASLAGAVDGLKPLIEDLIENVRRVTGG